MIPRPLINFISFLDFLNPYLCMRFTAYLWTKPLKPKRNINEEEFLLTSDNFFLKVKAINKTIKCYHWVGDGPKIILVHGWSGRASNMSKIINKLNQNNFDVYAFDAPAHGESSGGNTNLPEFISCIESLASKVSPIYALVGHSLGGFASVYCAAKKIRLDKIILLCPVNNVFELFETFFNHTRLKKKTRNLMINYFIKKTGIIINKQLASEKLVKQIKAKILLIHDESDAQLSILESKKIKKNIVHGTFYFTKGLGHSRLLRNTKVVDRIISFLKSGSFK
tara:strand:- start:1623 stop:2465 length:843 start_codon:yes stop_codon:yes gene_type:complete